MSQDEVILSARRSGLAHPETGAAWAAIVAATQPGDELRMVDCIGAGGNGLAAGYYYYALFRGGMVIAKMPGVIIN